MKKHSSATKVSVITAISMGACIAACILAINGFSNVALADISSTTQAPIATTTGFVMTSSGYVSFVSTTTNAVPDIAYALPQGAQWPAIKAVSAIVYDPVHNQVIYEKNADAVRSMASLVKLMTAAVADTLLNNSPRLMSQPIKIQESDNENIADINLKDGTSWSPEALLQYMLVGSSNKAAENIASDMIPRSSFISLMNFNARNMGLTNTLFNNPSGLPIVPKPTAKVPKPAQIEGGYTTARELAHMMWNIIQAHSALLGITRAATASFIAGKNNIVQVQNTNKLIDNLPIAYGKTGFTDEAGGNLAIVIQKNASSTPYVIVVLGSTEDDRFNDTAALATTTMSVPALWQQ